MARFLLGWELGAGVGYRVRLRAIGEALVARGHTVAFAVPADPEGILGEAERFEAPRYSGPLPPGFRRPFQPTGLQDVLAINGFGTAASLTPMLTTWDRVFGAFGPDAVVADYAPALWCAASGRIPTLVISHGFATPARVGSTIARHGAGRPLTSDAALLAVIQEARAGVELSAPATLGALFEPIGAAAVVLPELDPHCAVREPAAVGPLAPLPVPVGFAEPSIYAYLASDTPGWAAWLQALGSLGVAGSVHVRGGPAVSPVPLGRLRWLPAMPPLDEVVSRCSVVVHHGGISTAHAAIGAGRPQLVWPNRTEQLLTARRVQDLGLGLGIGGAPDPRAIAERLQRLLGDPSFRRAAADLSDRARARSPVGSLPRVLTSCEALL